MALKITQDKLNYIKALAASQNLYTSNPGYAIAFTSKGGLLNRVKRIQNQTFMKKKGYEGFIATTLVFISMVLLSFTFERSNPKDEEYYNTRNNFNQTQPSDTSKPKKKHRVKVIQSEKAENDSLDIIVKTISDELDEVPEEMHQLIEIAYGTDDDSLAKIICQSVNMAMNEHNDSSFKIDINMKDFDNRMKDFNIAMKDFDANMKDFDFKMQEFDEKMKDCNVVMKSNGNNFTTVQIFKDGDTLNHEFDIPVMKDEMKEAEKAMKEYEFNINHNDELKILDELEIEKIIEEAMKEAQISINADENDIDAEDGTIRKNKSDSEMEEQLRNLEKE